jgi:Protein of unknown function, DUF488
VAELATSSYRQFRPSMGTPVRITLGKPRFRLAYEYEEIRLLAPPPRVFALQDREEFEAAYRQHLDAVGAERLRQVFERVSGEHGGRRLVLLCFENVLAGESCHRRMFARWWKEQTGQDVPELDPARFDPQQTLFNEEEE